MGINLSDRIRLSDVKAPVIEVELPDGEVRIIDPFEAARRLEAALPKEAGLTDTINCIREVLGLTPDVRDHHVILLSKTITDFIKREVESKTVPPVQRS